MNVFVLFWECVFDINESISKVSIIRDNILGTFFIFAILCTFFSNQKVYTAVKVINYVSTAWFILLKENTK